MVGTCLTCKVHEKMNKGDIPKWYKEIGNDSLLPPILNRNKDYSMENKSKFKKETPKITDISVSVNIDKEESDKWLFYWASDPQESYTLINDPKTAYNNEDNHGLIKLNKDGEAKIELNCPQPYKVDKITYPRHVHYTLEKDGEWDEKIRTYIITCELNLKQFDEILDKKSHIILNALDEKSFEEYHIPDTHNLNQKSLNELTKSRKTLKIKKFIKSVLNNYPELDEKKLNILDIPIVTYCEKKECDASSKLLEHLIDSGFTNVLEYPGGNVEYKNKSNKDDKESDAKEEKIVKITDDIYDINKDYETLIYEGIKYKHNILKEELYYQDNLIGIWNGQDIEWKTENDKMKHVVRVNEKLNEKKEDKEDKVDKVDKVDKESSDEEEESSDEEDESSDEEEEKPIKQNDKLDELKRILNLNTNKSIKSIDEKTIDRKSKNKNEISNVSVKDKSYISKKRFDEEFKGWGWRFSFYQ
jgi:hypothetical protein